jgi:hypothetical protein
LSEGESTLPSDKELNAFVEKNIDSFHKSRLNGIESLLLEKILLRKNPYLFKAKNILTAASLVQVLLDAYLSSQEETMFGEFMEKLAIFVAKRSYGARKSSAEGIDMELEVGGIIYIVAIKSGPNWGNSSQIKKMKSNFEQASNEQQERKHKGSERVLLRKSKGH